MQTQSGQDWFIHFQEVLPYGRIVHLQPMRWVDDWPVMGIDGNPVTTFKKPDVGRNWPVAVPQTSDEFDSPTLGLQWQWWANYRDDWYSLAARPGFLRLKALTFPASLPLFDHPNLLLQKFPAERFTATASLDLSGLTTGNRAGLVVAGMRMAALQVEKDSAGFKIFRTSSMSERPHGFRGHPTTGPQNEEAEATVPGPQVFLRLHVEPGGQCAFSFSSDGRNFTALGDDFHAVNDLWIGAKVGLFCNAPPGKPSGGYADIDWFRIGP